MAMDAEIVERLLGHILDIAQSRCSITEAELEAEGDETIQAILAGLLHLYEELELREQRRREAELEARALSTPVLELGARVLLLPLIGNLDADRAEQLLVRALDAVRDRGARVVVVDVTGLASVDTFVAGRILDLFAAARLLGTEAILTGLSAQNAQTLVALDIDLGDVRTLSTLGRGLQLAFALTRDRR